MMILFLVLILLLSGISLFFMGYWWPTINLDQVSAPTAFYNNKDLYDLANQIAEKERQQNPPVLAGQEKWIYPKDLKEQAEYSLVFLHGFSASPKEIHPVMETLSDKTGWPVFFQRLSFHAQTPDAMGQLRAEDLWLDALEALEVGLKLGKKTILVGSSTGGTLAALLAAKYPEQVAGVILVSPNFGLTQYGSRLLRGPLGVYLSKILLGPYRQWTPINEDVAKYWMTKYDSRALPSMIEMIALSNKVDYSKFSTPAMFVVSPQDDVVYVKQIKWIYEQMQSSEKLWLEFPNAPHVLTGNWQYPQSIPDFVSHSLVFFEKLKEKH